MTKPQTTNCSDKPVGLDEATFIKAIGMIRHRPDTVKSILMNSTSFKDMADKHCVYKSDGPAINAVMGIKIETNDLMPKHLAVLHYVSGKKVVLNLIDGKIAELPQMKEPEISFDYKYGEGYYGRI